MVPSLSATTKKTLVAEELQLMMVALAQVMLSRGYCDGAADS